MEFYAEILAAVLANQDIRITFPSLEGSVEKIVEGECYKALQKIKYVLEDDSLDDVECFHKIEKIVCIFEELGSNCGARHDF